MKDQQTFTTQDARPMTFGSACKTYFGLKPQQAAMDFMRELAALTDADRADIRTGLENAGFRIIATPLQG